MYKTNKELMNALTKHFLESDPKEVARALANMLLDLHRVGIYEELPLDEQVSLLERTHWNQEEFLRFSKEGPRKGEKFTTINMNSDGSP